ncbi:MAG: VCBS repeat-containing protein [Phycisphaerales bacterium]|nr:VCBS repeat-containing protein [Phycisphaerales bacterium]
MPILRHLRDSHVRRSAPAFAIAAGVAAATLLPAVGCNGPQRGQGGPPADPPAPITFELRAAGLPEKGIWKCDPAVGDINGDGLLDLAAIPRLQPSTLAWINGGKGNWQTAAAGLDWGRQTCGGDIELADVNRDGKLDIVVADHCHGISVFLGDGAGRWSLAADRLHPMLTGEDGSTTAHLGAESVTVGDVNGDGHPDLVAVGSDDGGINVWHGDGTGSNWTRVDDDLPKTRFGVRVLLHDVNGDGRLDILCTREEGPRCWLNNGDGTWGPYSVGFPSPVSGGIYNGLAVADLNRDGRPDVIVGNWIDGPEVYLQRADGAWQKQPTVFPDCKGGGWGVAVADMDQDGHLDIVFCGRLPQEVGYVYGVFLLLGDGTGSSWRYIRNSGLPNTGLEYSWGVEVADFNNDGVPDIVAVSGSSPVSGEQTAPVVPQRVLTWFGKKQAR